MHIVDVNVNFAIGMVPWANARPSVARHIGPRFVLNVECCGADKPTMGGKTDSSNRYSHVLDRRVRPVVALLGSIALVVALALADSLTGPYLVFSTFYLMPVVIVAWYGDRWQALLVSALAVLVGAVTVALHPGAISPVTYVLNAIFRLVTFVFVVYLVDAERHARAKVAELSSIDPLTGLLNRRAFYEQAAARLRESVRRGEPLSVVYADLDDLKARNDREGHQSGDALLVEFATLLRTTFRDSDLLARFGGDEFCCLLPRSGLTEASAVLDRFDAALRDAGSGPIRASAGVVEITPDADTELLALVGEADALMYEAKQAGKGTRRSKRLSAPG
jgi:diguanylate cyclase (GGDEF)-like protein